MLENLTYFTAFLYVIGLLLLLVEAIVPGFGVAGVGGIVCVVISIAMITTNIFEAALFMVGTAAVLILVIIALYKLGIGKRALGKMILSTEQKNNEGYTSNTDYREYVGKRGIAYTDLRSAGTVLVNSEKLDAVSEGEFIDKGVPIEIIRVEGRKIIVRRTDNK